ncbi:MAG: peptidoglycan-binding protein, partial [Aestuariivirga sp.]
MMGRSNLRRYGVVLALGLILSSTTLQAQGLFSSTATPFKKPEAPIQPAGTPTTVTEIVDGKNEMAMLQSNSAKLLQDASAKYAAIISQGGFPTVSGWNYKKGDKSAAIATLNRRLFIEGYLRVEGTQGVFANVFTSATDDALRRFQRNHGLAVNGKVDPATVAELNVPADKRLATINANIPRLETYEQGLGDRYIVVNIPAQQLEA